MTYTPRPHGEYLDLLRVEISTLDDLIKKYQNDSGFQIARASLLANRDTLERHKPEILYVIGESEGSFDSEQELLDSFTEQELKESPPEITTFIICEACGGLNAEIQENADEWVYQPEVYFPCPSYTDITKHLDLVMGER